jgi:drug/metabolite transporter (DMT)-like permease
MRVFSHHTAGPAIAFALAAAVLFGAGTPFAKTLVGEVHPVLLAGLLYLGSGLALAVWQVLAPRLARQGTGEAPLRRADLPWLIGAVAAGGVLGPALLMLGLASTLASSASLLLNLEGVLTVVLAWLVFGEHVDRRIALGMAAITAGGLLLSWEGRPDVGVAWGPLAVAGACLAWAVDNNLTRKVSGGNPTSIACAKGLVAGTVNLSLGLLAGAMLPEATIVAEAGILGLLSYGVSLALFVLALRHLGTARTSAYFSVAPFVGAAVAVVLLGDEVSTLFLVAAVFMGIGVWLHVTERHEHEHVHEPLEHDHRHVHDEHHQHDHMPTDPPGEPHSHPHRHVALRHSHPHYPDIHHRHQH